MARAGLHYQFQVLGLPPSASDEDIEAAFAEKEAAMLAEMERVRAEIQAERGEPREFADLAGQFHAEDEDQRLKDLQRHLVELRTARGQLIDHKAEYQRAEGGQEPVSLLQKGEVQPPRFRSLK